MLDQFLVGIAAGICNIAIHALLMTLVVRGARAMGHQHVRWPSMRLTAVMMITAVILKVAHTTEIMVWALTYRLVGAVPEGTGSSISLS